MDYSKLGAEAPRNPFLKQRGWHVGVEFARARGRGRSPVKESLEAGRSQTAPISSYTRYQDKALILTFAVVY